MAHSIARTTPPIPPVGGGDAGPLSLEETTRTEWDILMTRDDRWVTCRAGITDPEELARELEWFQLGNPSGSVTYRVLERTITLRERLLDAPPAPATARRGGARTGAGPDGGSGGRSDGRSANRPLDRRGGSAPVEAEGASPHRAEGDAPSVVAAGGTTQAQPTQPATELPVTPRVTQHVTDPLTARCPSCRAPEGVPCRTPSGKTAAQLHRARGDAAQQLYFDDIASARQRGISIEELYERRAALRSAGRQALSEATSPLDIQRQFTDEGMP